jgi:hypothetical protein
MPEFKLVWDSIGERLLEAGLDRGVLYLEDAPGVAWNGLVSLQDNTQDSSEPVYYNGVKLNDIPRTGEYVGTLTAITYPDEFFACDGFEDMGRGFFVDDQVPKQFSLSFRTLVADAVDGLDASYKVHILYNLMATPSTKAYITAAEQANPTVFSWDISAVPEEVEGFKPTSHVILDGTQINRFLLSDLEDILYGSTQEVVDGNIPGPPTIDGGNPDSIYVLVDVLDGGVPSEPLTYPRLLPLSELVDIARTWTFIIITNNGDGTWSASGPDEVITMIDTDVFQIEEVNAVYLDANTYEISNT